VTPDFPEEDEIGTCGEKVPLLLVLLRETQFAVFVPWVLPLPLLCVFPLKPFLTSLRSLKRFATPGKTPLLLPHLESKGDLFSFLSHEKAPFFRPPPSSPEPYAISFPVRSLPTRPSRLKRVFPGVDPWVTLFLGT